MMKKQKTKKQEEIKPEKVKAERIKREKIKPEKIKPEKEKPDRKKPERGIQDPKKKEKKRLILIVSIAVVMVAALAVLIIFLTTQTTASGTFGDNATWSIENDVLTISGSGDLIDSDYYQPWRNHTSKFSKVVIKEGITGIGSNNFYYLNNLHEVELPTTLKTIGKSAFSYSRYLSDISIPEGVESIGTWAFYATQITSITVPDSVTYLGSYAFDNCFMLESVSLSDSLTTINRDMFLSDYALKTVKLPKNLNLICQNAFCGCSSLESITLPDTVTKINSSAFSGCTNLRSINLPGGVKIGKGAFDNTPELQPTAVITLQPTDVHLPAPGGEAAVSVAAEGESIKYNWYYRNAGDTKWKKSVEHSSTYSTEMTAARYGRQVYCEVLDMYKRSVNSKTATLTFETGLKITLQPTNAEVAQPGDDAVLTIGAEGDGLKYAWYYKNPSWKNWSKSSCKTSTYNTPVTEDHYGREIYCVVTDKYGAQVKSNTITITYKK